MKLKLGIVKNLLSTLDPRIFTRLPTPVKAILSVLVGASLLTIAYYFFSGNATAMLIIGTGVVAVFTVMYLFRKIVKGARKAKANPLAQGLTGNAAATPQGISEPARRARLDDLRRNFEQGVEKFRAAGKNLYSVPWYVLVGEPGSGKTEAIRHCNVGFPPGLQDQLQGAGGTLNMNWWFTNQAIILDTAGRLMFEEVVPGSTNEWNEFLKLLKANRPNCPINGMLLVIPVDTLIKDSADSIEKKAGKIAQQFDQIQRILGVRFPVFIIITKCDLLNGFREFFDDLNDPQLQHQIMGWSNPAPLDQKFDPKAVTDHMENVKKRLTDRRQQLLLDPVNTEDAQGRRIDQVDALYALPDSLTKIAPRLRRYLEMVFVAGEWSPKPLFLRGIYFTSSMTEGSALDAELAEVLGVSVDALPEGKVWRRDRAYFLRDLFIEKVFREKGLVTRADNADKQQRARRSIVMTVGFMAVIVLGVLTWLGHRSLENHIGVHRDLWLAAAKTSPQYMPIIKKNNVYNDDPVIPIGKKSLTVAEFFDDNLKLVKTPIEIPWIFRPMAYISGDVNTERRHAYRALYEATVLSPLYVAARNKIAALTPATWTDDATSTLAQLMKLEYADAFGKHPESEVIHPQVDLDPMFRFVLSPADYTKASKDITNDNDGLQSSADFIYSGPDKAAWPAKMLNGETIESRKTVSEGITHMIDYWKAQATDKSPRMGNILIMRQALMDFRDAENKLLVLRTRQVQKLDPYTNYVTEWEAAYRDMITARNKAQQAWTAMTSKGTPDSATLRTLYSDALDQLVSDAKKAYDGLMKFTPSEIDSAKANASAQSLFSDRQQLLAGEATLGDWKNSAEAKATLADIATLDDSYLAFVKGIDGNPHHRFEVQAQIYELANGLLPRPGAAAATQTASLPLGKALDKVDTDVTNADDTISKAVFEAREGDRLSKAGDLTRYTVDLGARYRRYVLTKAAVDAMPTDAEKWPAYITALAPSFPQEHMLRPPVPMATADKYFLAKYSPDAVGATSDAMNSIDKLLADSTTGKILDKDIVSSRAAAIRKALNLYLADYRTYWLKGALDELHFANKNWKTFSDSLGNVTEPLIRDSLQRYLEKSIDACTRINDNADMETLRADIQVGARPPFQEQCADALRNWKNLGDDYHLARTSILAMDPSKFPDRYSVGIAKNTPESFVARYWVGLPLEALRVLANDSQKDILEGLKDLAKYQHFPLAPPGNVKDDLTGQQVILARAALEKVKGAGGAALAAGALSIGQGGQTKDKALDDALELLRGTNLLKSMQRYLDNMERFFAVLPMNNQPMTVNIAVIKDARLKELNAVSQKYAYMLVSQGPKELRETYLQGDIPDAVDVDYPAGDLKLQFRDVPKGPVLETDTISGPWAPFRLIKAPNVRVLKREGTKWTLEYTVKDTNGKSWLLWLLLDFKAEVPDLKDWPVPPVNAAPGQ